MNRLLVPLLFVLAVSAQPSHAVFKLTETVEKLYTEADAVLVASVSEVRTDGDSQLILAEVKEAPRGTPAADKLRLVVKKPELHFKSIATGQPLVVFITKASRTRGAVAVHAGDKWVMASAAGGAQTWMPYKDNLALGLAFPGRTTALVRLLEQYKAGKAQFLNAVEDRVYTGGVKSLGRLPVTSASQLLAVDLDGDKVPELLAASPEKLHIFKRTGEGLADATGAGAAKAAHYAAGDVNADGKPDLLTAGQVLVNTGDGWRAIQLPQPPDQTAVAASALLDITADQKPDAVFVTRAGELRVHENAPDRWKPHPARSLWKENDDPAATIIGPFAEDGSAAVIVAREGGLTRYALSGDAMPDDFTRLTGDSLQKYLTPTGGKLKDPTLTLIDPNGDGRPDLLLTAERFAMVLFNRGHGAFFASTVAGAPLLPSDGQPPLPFTLSARTPITSADLRGDKHPDLLVLGEDGTLYEVTNPAPAH